MEALCCTGSQARGKGSVSAQGSRGCWSAHADKEVFDLQEEGRRAADAEAAAVRNGGQLQQAQESVAHLTEKVHGRLWRYPLNAPPRLSPASCPLGDGL